MWFQRNPTILERVFEVKRPDGAIPDPASHRNGPASAERPTGGMGTARRTWLKGPWVAVAACLLLFACGSVGVSSGGHAATKATAVPVTGGGGSGAAGQPLGGLGRAVVATPGKVTVSPSADSYGPGQLVSATIANGLDRTVFTSDSKTGCSIATLEHAEGGGWSAVSGCPEMRPPAMVAIGPSRGRTVEFDPSTLSPTGGSLEAGTYRVTFTYGLDRQQVSEPLAAHSPTFQITG